MKLEIKNLPYYIIGILLVLIFFNTCGRGDGRKGKDDSTKVDTVYIDRVIKGETVTITETNFVPKYIYKTDPKYLDSINKLNDENERLEYLLSELQTRVYDTTYAFERGRLHITDSVHGYLKGRKLTWDLDDYEYQEAIITKTVKKYPKFAISGGLSSQLTTDFSLMKYPTLGIEIGFRNRQGYNLDVGYNLRKEFEITLKKDIFVSY